LTGRGPGTEATSTPVRLRKQCRTKKPLRCTRAVPDAVIGLPVGDLVAIIAEALEDYHGFEKGDDEWLGEAECIAAALGEWIPRTALRPVGLVVDGIEFIPQSIVDAYTPFGTPPGADVHVVFRVDAP
jgi:hypothetical protein